MNEYYEFTNRYYKEDDVHVGICLELNLSTYADTRKECEIALEETIEDYLDILKERELTDKVLNDKGIYPLSNNITYLSDVQSMSIAKEDFKRQLVGV